MADRKEDNKFDLGVKGLTRALYHFGKNYLGICWNLNLGCEESLPKLTYCYRRHCITEKNSYWIISINVIWDCTLSSNIWCDN